MRRIAALLVITACSHPAKPVPKPSADAPDPDGPHRAAIAAQVQPLIDGEVIHGLVIGVFDGGKPQIYGFGKGPHDKPPNGRTLFDLGSMTKVYTGLLLAESVQRKEIELEGPIADLMPPGVTVPMDQVAITPKHLALHSSGLPPMPPSLLARQPPPDPFAGYTEDAFYQDLISTKLLQPPGTTIVLSYYGTGLLGLALGRKIGGGYSAAINARVLQPLQLHDTFTTLPAGVATRRAIGTDEDLKPRSRWTWGALVGAGGLISTARDQLKLIELELDAAAGSKGPLRGAMRLTQEAQLDQPGENEGIGWMIDSAGRMFHDGTTGGFRGYISFDPKTRRGVVVLASTESSLIDILGKRMFDVMDGTAKPPAPAPTAEVVATYAGTYDFGGTPLKLIADGKRLYLEGPGEPRHRLVPFGDRTFWTEALQAAAKFELEGNQVKALVFQIGGKQIRSVRVGP